MADHIQAELAERYLLRSVLFWRMVRDSRFPEWQKRARSAAWKNVVWNWSELGISESARATAQTLEFVPSEVFAHPEIIATDPELKNYYRLLACLPNKGLAQITSAAVRKDPLALCKFLNGFLSSLLALTTKSSRESLLRACAEINASTKEASVVMVWDDRIADRHSPSLRRIVKGP